MNFSINILQSHKNTLFSAAVEKLSANYLQDFLKLFLSIVELHYNTWVIFFLHIKGKISMQILHRKEIGGLSFGTIGSIFY